MPIVCQKKKHVMYILVKQNNAINQEVKRRGVYLFKMKRDQYQNRKILNKKMKVCQNEMPPKVR